VPAEPLERTEPLVRADSVRDLRGLRRDLAARAGDASLPAGSEPALEDFLLAVDEMTTNALRHGRPPVEVVVTTAADRSWLLTVSDAAGELPPTPALGRDAALGGLGLYMVAGLADAHGWTRTADGRKTVWARIDLAGAEGPAGGPAPVPAPRERR
jgi:signal transduction histidine kinase